VVETFNYVYIVGMMETEVETRLTDGPHGREYTFVDTTEEACFVLFESGTDESWNMLVRGPLREVPDPAVREVDDTTLSTDLSPIRASDEDIEGIDLVVFELEMDSVVGRRTVDR